MKTFDLKKELEAKGFQVSEKSREMVATKDLCAIYYAVDSIIEDGNPVGIKVYDASKSIVFEGVMPRSIDDLDSMLNI